MTTHKKRNSVVVLAIIGAIAMAGAAYAYWSAGGSGTGSATTGTNAPIVAKQTSTNSNMYPGDSAQTISGNFDNGNAGPAYVSTVTVSIGSVVKATGAPAGTCDATDYTLANATMTVNAEVPAGTAKGAFTGASIKFNNKASNQDACKNATVNLAYVIA